MTKRIYSAISEKTGICSEVRRKHSLLASFILQYRVALLLSYAVLFILSTGVLMSGSEAPLAKFIFYLTLTALPLCFSVYLLSLLLSYFRYILEVTRIASMLPITYDEFIRAGCNSREDAIFYLLMILTLSHNRKFCFVKLGSGKRTEKQLEVIKRFPIKLRKSSYAYRDHELFSDSTVFASTADEFNLRIDTQESRIFKLIYDFSNYLTPEIHDKVYSHFCHIKDLQRRV